MLLRFNVFFSKIIPFSLPRDCKHVEKCLFVSVSSTFPHFSRLFCRFSVREGRSVTSLTTRSAPHSSLTARLALRRLGSRGASRDAGGGGRGWVRERARPRTCETLAHEFSRSARFLRGSDLHGGTPGLAGALFERGGPQNPLTPPTWTVYCSLIALSFILGTLDRCSLYCPGCCQLCVLGSDVSHGGRESSCRTKLRSPVQLQLGDKSVALVCFNIEDWNADSLTLQSDNPSPPPPPHGSAK
ncbi:hypothetical protein GN956_G23284 [Arapaima gigas]